MQGNHDEIRCPKGRDAVALVRETFSRVRKRTSDDRDSRHDAVEGGLWVRLCSHLRSFEVIWGCSGSFGSSREKLESVRGSVGSGSMLLGSVQ